MIATFGHVYHIDQDGPFALLRKCIKGEAGTIRNRGKKAGLV